MPLTFSALRTNLFNSLNAVGRIVPSKSTLPIISNVLLESNNGMIRLTATNLTTTVKHDMGAMIEEEGATTVPYRLLMDIVRSLPDDRIDFEVTKDEDTGAQYIVVKCGKSVSRIAVADAKDYPPTDTLVEGSELKVNAKTVENIISKVKLSAASDESRPVLEGISVKASADNQDMVFAAADGFRLSVCRIGLQQAIEEDLDIIVPRETMEEVQRLCNRGAGDLVATIPSESGRIQFENENTVIISQVINGNFPNYEQLIPDRYDTRIILDKKEFNQSVTAAAAFTKESSSGVVRFLVNTGVDKPDEAKGDGEQSEPAVDSDETEPDRYMEVRAGAEDIGDYRTRMSAEEYEGYNNRIAINVRYLSDLDRQMKDDQFSLEFTNPSSPAAFVSQDRKDVHVIMPMYVQW